MHYLKLQNNSAKSLEMHILSFELNMRKQKTLLAFQAVKQLLKLDKNNPDSHRCLIRFFHKISSFPAAVTESEKLISSVLEAERAGISQLHGKSLVEANKSFPERNEDSLLHRAVAAEMIQVLEPQKKIEAIKIIEDSTNNIAPGDGVMGPVREWKLEDCVAVHRLLETVFVDLDAASRWKARCAEDFSYSTHFGGHKSTIVARSFTHSMLNGALCHEPESEDTVALNGKLHAFSRT